MKKKDLKRWLKEEIRACPLKRDGDRTSLSERLQLWGREEALKEVLEKL